jgi:YD repeat-containing protein
MPLFLLGVGIAESLSTSSSIVTSRLYSLPSSWFQGSAPILTVSADTSNRISGFCYDAAGNLLAQSAAPCPSPTYTYDADGNRVQKSSGKLYWYGSGSVILDESDATGNITKKVWLRVAPSCRTETIRDCSRS